jgi:undecaprenyl phosphate N,N'-diacetylbacillosamine 1-phosphate transferase
MTGREFQDLNESMMADAYKGRHFYDQCHRLLDIVIAVPLLLLLTPVFLGLALLIRLDSRGPALFLQERLGRHGRPFRILKFRTMSDGIPVEGDHLFIKKEDPRITRIGSILRSLSLDEIPQLVNVITGQMSIVGPRPPVPWWPYEYGDYSIDARIRFLVRPGITGYSQAIARREASWEKRLEHDTWYVRNRSLGLYFWILWRTLFRVITRTGIDRPAV